MIPFLWRLLRLDWLWKFLFGDWLVRRVWGDDGEQRRRSNGDRTDDER